MVSGVSYFGLTILLLSLLDTDYSPISQVASDYGVGRFAIAMNLGFLVGGLGLIAFASAILLQRTGQRSRLGSILFFIAGAILVTDSYFTTILEGAPATLHGTIHGFGGFVFFLTAPIGTLLVYRRINRRRFLVALAGVVAAFAFLALSSILSLNAGGLAEHLILLAVFSSVIVASLTRFLAALRLCR